MACRYCGGSSSAPLCDKCLERGIVEYDKPTLGILGFQRYGPAPIRRRPHEPVSEHPAEKEGEEQGMLHSTAGYGPLLWVNEPIDVPLLTVAISEKWYELYLLLPNGRVEGLHFGHLDDLKYRREESAYVDHVPNPRAVERFARAKGYHIDPNALDMIRGRWRAEIVEQDFEDDEE
jgi:hypothetical protein